MNFAHRIQDALSRKEWRCECGKTSDKVERVLYEPPRVMAFALNWDRCEAGRGSCPSRTMLTVV